MKDLVRIAELPAAKNGGMIGIMSAPSSSQAGGIKSKLERVLAADLDIIESWGAAAVVTIITEQEIETLAISTLGTEVRSRFMEWLHLPVRDGHAPDPAFDAAWPSVSSRLRSLIEAGARVLVHCEGGLGSGAIAARLLVEMDEVPQVAIARVRTACPGAIETAEQTNWVQQGRAQPNSVAVDLDAVQDRAIGAMLGLAVGDAVGTTIEFSAKPTRAVLHDMIGGGPFSLKPGQWTDDTSMALALADSLLAAPEFDARDLTERFVRWWRHGEYSCSGKCFDIGNTVRDALRRFESNGDPFAGSTDPASAGNGSIMRLAPVAIRYWYDEGTRTYIARQQSLTTHGAAEAIEACWTLSDILATAIRGASLAELVTSDASRRVKGFELGQDRSIVEGSGYVVESLHAALWAVSRTSTFESAVLLAANLGRDADTTAAIAGQIAGALYGASGIPPAWLEKLAWRDRIEETASELFVASVAGSKAYEDARLRFTWGDGDVTFYENGVEISRDEILRRHAVEAEMVLDVEERAAEKAASAKPEGAAQ